ncbi:hypothetical protein EVAR_33758_1 [Eumeta japonica]|uniref:Uncharacterized protein n=1 Tax=Eumeta variegata TaxID=151549 RepID=A0A4C1VVM3_EUMVA|nr:hypothetical protein EVAR_33758_1 [Eumeta japonica]
MTDGFLTRVKLNHPFRASVPLSRRPHVRVIMRSVTTVINNRPPALGRRGKDFEVLASRCDTTKSRDPTQAIRILLTPFTNVFHERRFRVKNKQLHTQKDESQMTTC